MTIHCLGNRAPGFALNVTSATTRNEFVLADRFTAFRRLLATFARMVETEEPGIDPDDTLTVMEALMARHKASGTAGWAPVERSGSR